METLELHPGFFPALPSGHQTNFACQNMETLDCHPVFFFGFAQSPSNDGEEEKENREHREPKRPTQGQDPKLKGGKNYGIKQT